MIAVAPAPPDEERLPPPGEVNAESFSVTCPCGSKLRVKAALRGKQGECPACGRRLTFSQADELGVVVPPLPLNLEASTPASIEEPPRIVVSNPTQAHAERSRDRTLIGVGIFAAVVFVGIATTTFLAKTGSRTHRSQSDERPAGVSTPAVEDADDPPAAKRSPSPSESSVTSERLERANSDVTSHVGAIPHRVVEPETVAGPPPKSATQQPPQQTAIHIPTMHEAPLLSSTASSPREVGEFSFTGLGDLAGGEFKSHPMDVSANGKVVVGYSESEKGPEAFLWTRDGGMVGLGRVPGDDCSIATAVSDNGKVVAGVSVELEFILDVKKVEAFVWVRDTGMIGLGTSPPRGLFAQAGLTDDQIVDAILADAKFKADSVPFVSIPLDVSADGSFVVGLCGYALNEVRLFAPFMWTLQGGMVPLRTIDLEYNFSFASAVSSTGSFVAGAKGDYSRNDHVGSIAPFFLSRDDHEQSLGNLIQDRHAAAYCPTSISDSGDVVVGVGGESTIDLAMSHSTLWDVPFRWTRAEGIVPLGGALPEGGPLFATGRGVTPDGSIAVGGSQSSGEPDLGPYVWTPQSGAIRLRDLLVAGGVEGLEDWKLSPRAGISADGRTIVGWGANPKGKTEGWVATIGTSADKHRNRAIGYLPARRPRLNRRSAKSSGRAWNLPNLPPASPAPPPRTGFLPVGDPAPDFSFISLDEGLDGNLAQYRGRIVIVDFWASWCGPCMDSLKKLNVLRAAHPEWSDQVEILAVSIDQDRAAALKALETEGWTGFRTVYTAPSGVSSYKITAIPTTYVLDPNGRIAAVDHHPDLATIVASLLPE